MNDETPREQTASRRRKGRPLQFRCQQKERARPRLLLGRPVRVIDHWMISGSQSCQPPKTAAAAGPATGDGSRPTISGRDKPADHVCCHVAGPVGQPARTFRPVRSLWPAPGRFGPIRFECAPSRVGPLATAAATDPSLEPEQTNPNRIGTAANKNHLLAFSSPSPFSVCL